MPELLAYIRQIARMTMDGEPVDDGNDTYYDFTMENDDAVSTLNQLIEEARDLEARAKGGCNMTPLKKPVTRRSEEEDANGADLQTHHYRV